MARISDRILKELEADLIENRARYDATIENFSEKGIKVITDTAVDILPDETIDL